MKRAVLTSARLHAQELRGHRFWPCFVTLTYADGDTWAPNHIRSFLDNLRHWSHRRGIRKLRYVWTAELQDRGAVHYHLILWVPHHVRRLPMPDSSGWWPHGSSRIERARDAVAYVAKYVSKGGEVDQDGCLKALPKGARLHGSGGLSGASRAIRSWWMGPQWLRDLWGSEHRARRAPGGGWQSRLTGELVRSSWRYLGFRDGKVWLVDESESSAAGAGALACPRGA
jgi:hypothetical protein